MPSHIEFYEQDSKEAYYEIGDYDLAPDCWSNYI
jgi:hypothetical protein